MHSGHPQATSWGRCSASSSSSARPCAPFLLPPAAVVSHVAANPGSFSAENIADVVYAISKCGFCHPDLVGLVERAAGLLLEEAPADGGEVRMRL